MTQHPAPVTPDTSPADLNTLTDAMLKLRNEVVSGAERRLKKSHPDCPDIIPFSARNLAQYLALRAMDLRPLQMSLTRQGLSSLGRTEAHVMASINQVLRVLTRLTHRSHEADPEPTGIDFDRGLYTLKENADHLFGTPPTGRNVRIMVTLPREAALHEDLVLKLMETGMDCARINCAHDDPEAWSAMIRHLRSAEQRLNTRCTILMDLAGHKLRTGPLAHRPPVSHVKPRRNLLGRMVQPAQVILTPANATPMTAAGEGVYQYLLPSPCLERMQVGDRLVFEDTRGKRRRLNIMETLDHGGRLATLDRSAYFTNSTRFIHERPDEMGHWQEIQTLQLVWPELEPVTIRLFKDDLLYLTRSQTPGQPATVDDSGQCLLPAHIACTTPKALAALAPGQKVWIDDGKIGGTVDHLTDDGVMIRITHCRPQGHRLRPDRGINFPSASLNLPGLSPQDLEHLDFVVAHADLVGYSFVESREDMVLLMDELARRGGSDLGIVAKIETCRAVENLPEIILATLGRHRLGVMIARGDLAVEIGGERLAEIQEEILWLCEAAHVPVIWATQVLESLAKEGLISRPELTDAAMAGRAECVMLNKGPYILDALQTLDSILVRMQAHQHKKTAQLRALRLAG
ncbi:pyruvate kinase [Ectothiorhodospira lacustris]|uniref:pyruvate kinase n=1 Tax=Ectothiorhodospira lacustris TaxID=2899127 RepID=UPI001EE8FF81|nr:pyruvate kinase [Ectothiorhodospira lacustris]MCG5509576.1 pyruvate kinase [Ectothiorhodospira lacustris]MCG5521629.1 pyruvate kinase [Ectothiorhodospira lacustris]